MGWPERFRLIDLVPVVVLSVLTCFGSAAWAVGSGSANAVREEAAAAHAAAMAGAAAMRRDALRAAMSRSET